MDKHFNHELEELKKQLLKMVGLVEESISRSVKALKESNADVSKDVIMSDEIINMLEIQIEEFCLKLLALHQPTAVDLRFITSVLKMNNDLERIGDLAVNISERTLELIRQPLLKPLIDIPRMAELVQKMVRDSIDALVKRDSNLARNVCVKDDEVDDLNDQIFRELLTYMIQDPRAITSVVGLIFVGKYLERISDHATNIAEDVIYYIKGETIKHHIREKKGG